MPRRARTGLSIAAAIALSGGVVAAVVATQVQLQAQALVRHTLIVERSLDKTLIDAQAAEASQRALLLTGEPVFAAALQRSATAAVTDLRHVADLTRDNPRQRANLLAVSPVLQRVLAPRGAALRAGAAAPQDALASLINRSTSDMASARGALERMQAQEERLLATRTRDVQVTVWVLQLILLGLALGLAGIGALAFEGTARQLEESRAAEAELRGLSERLAAEGVARTAAEEQVNHLQRLESLGQLTGGIAHDFNNMLAVIVGSLDLAKSRLQRSPERARAHLDTAMEGATRAGQLTSRLLAFARRQSLSPEQVDVNRFVLATAEMLQRTLGEPVRVETVLAPGVWPITADPVQLEGAIVNLALNGRDAMSGAGKLVIETANEVLDAAFVDGRQEVQAGEYVTIAVSDSGEGMTPEVAAKVFEPFFTTKPTGKGTGLGLSQVYGFIKQSGGHVVVVSQRGEGSTLRLYLPRSQSGVASPRAPVAVAAAAEPRGDETILVVEDDERVRAVSVEALRGMGYGVLEAADAAGALALLEASQVDLLFTDVVMPGMNGRELARRVRSRWPQVRILYTTGFTPDRLGQEGSLDEGAGVLPKPFTLEELGLKVRQSLTAAVVA